LKLLQHIRDEAHRFAITFHRSLREKRVISTQLTDVEGVGSTRATKLLREFGSVKGIQAASLEQIAGVVGVKAARNIKLYFQTSTGEAAENPRTDTAEDDTETLG
jgi:excinuclease ABC subunit C